MNFRGIPDAERDPHPRLTWLVEMGFVAGVALGYRKHEIWSADSRLAPGTLVVSNHQRDADVPIAGTTLCRRRGWRFEWPLPFFAAREDLFRSGFLADYLDGWPGLGALAGLVRLRWLFEVARAYPVRRVREFSLAETLDALCAAGLADAALAQVFNARGQRELKQMLGRLPARVAELPRPRLRCVTRWGLRRLQLKALRRIALGFRENVRLQLERQVGFLDAGRVVYWAPEGLISPTGHFGRVRLGVRWIYRHAARPPAILPVALSYDALTPGRCRVLVHIGRLTPGLDASGQAAFAAEVRRLIQDLYMLNPSHLLARFLLAGPTRFTGAEFCAWAQCSLRLLAPHAAALDPLLRTAGAGALWSRRLHWLAARRVLVRDRAGWRNLVDRSAAPGWQAPANIVRYLDNALADNAPAVARVLQP